MTEDHRMSLWAIDETIDQLVTMREEPDISEEERLAIDGQLEEWVSRQLEKFDGCYGYIRYEEQQAKMAKEVSDTADEWMQVHENRARRVRDMVKRVMDGRGIRRVSGAVGSFTICHNGGKQAVKIPQPDLVPDPFRVWRFSLSYAAFEQLKYALSFHARGSELLHDIKSIPDEAKVRAELERGEPVAGAYLEERGNHLRVG